MQQRFGMYGLVFAGKDMCGGAARAVEQLRAYFTLQDGAGAHSSDGHADEVAELDSISTEMCWHEVCSWGLYMQVGESLPIV